MLEFCDVSKRVKAFFSPMRNQSVCLNLASKSKLYLLITPETSLFSAFLGHKSSSSLGWVRNRVCQPLEMLCVKYIRTRVMALQTLFLILTLHLKNHYRVKTNHSDSINLPQKLNFEKTSLV